MWVCLAGFLEQGKNTEEYLYMPIQPRLTNKGGSFEESSQLSKKETVRSIFPKLSPRLAPSPNQRGLLSLPLLSQRYAAFFVHFLPQTFCAVENFKIKKLVRKDIIQTLVVPKVIDKKFSIERKNKC